MNEEIDNIALFVRILSRTSEEMSRNPKMQGTLWDITIKRARRRGVTLNFYLIDILVDIYLVGKFDGLMWYTSR